MSKTLTQEFADAFAAAWFEAWNSHDLDRILEHYAQDVVFSSPFAIEFTGGKGTVDGKAALRKYWSKALANFPDLKFTPGYAVPGISSISLVYTSVRDLRAVETMLFDDENLVCRVYCHYQPATE